MTKKIKKPMDFDKGLEWAKRYKNLGISNTKYCLENILYIRQAINRIYEYLDKAEGFLSIALKKYIDEK